MTQREAFEAYIDSCIESNYGFLKAVEKDEAGDYPTAWVQSRWLTWQAAQAQAAVGPVNEWKEAVLDTVAVYAMDFHVDTPPSVIVNQLIGMAVTMAKDPAINGAVEPAKDTQIVCTPVKPVAYWIPKAEQFCFASPTGRPFAKAWEPLYTSPPDHTKAMRLALEALREATSYTSCASWSPSMTDECNAAIRA